MENKKNKASLKNEMENLVADFDEAIIETFNELNPKKWRKAMDLLQETFKQSTENLLDAMYDDIGWND